MRRVRAAYRERSELLRLRNYRQAESQVIALPTPEVEVLDPLPAETEAATPTSWQLVVGLSALVALICSVDRAAMSVALGPMGKPLRLAIAALWRAW